MAFSGDRSTKHFQVPLPSRHRMLPSHTPDSTAANQTSPPLHHTRRHNPSPCPLPHPKAPQPGRPAHGFSPPATAARTALVRRHITLRCQLPLKGRLLRLDLLGVGLRCSGRGAGSGQVLHHGVEAWGVRGVGGWESLNGHTGGEGVP